MLTKLTVGWVLPGMNHPPLPLRRATDVTELSSESQPKLAAPRKTYANHNQELAGWFCQGTNQIEPKIQLDNQIKLTNPAS